MRPHLPALALALLAGAVYGLLVRPAHADLDALRAAERRAHAERREARAEWMRIERGRPRRGVAPASQPGGPAGARLLRQRVLRVLDGAPVRGVVLEVGALDPQAFPTVRLSAEGAFADLVTLAGRLAAAEAGLALDQVRFTQTPGGVRLDVQGTGWSVAP